MKKILFIVPGFPSISETFILNQIQSLIDLGYEVKIWAFDKEEKIVHPTIYKYHLLEKTVYPHFPNYLKRIYNLGKALLFSKHRLAALKSINVFKYNKDALALTNFCKLEPFLYSANQFDIIHVHFGQMLANLELIKDCGLVYSEKEVVTFHGYDLEPSQIQLYAKKYQYLLKNHLTVTVNTAYLKGIFNQVFPDYPKVFILPVGLDTEYFKPNNEKIAKDHISIVFCGRFIKLKGIERLPYIIQSILRQSSKKVKFHIIGDGEPGLKKLFLEKTDQNIKEGQVLYYGSLSQEKIKGIYAISDIFMLPGIYDHGRAETQGLVIQEAQACGLPVVITDAGGMKYGIIENETGFISPYQDDDAFVANLLRLIENDDLRIVMSQKARKFVIDNYDNKILTKTLIHIYER